MPKVGSEEEFKGVPVRMRRRCKSVQNAILQTQEMTVEKFMQAALARGLPQQRVLKLFMAYKDNKRLLR